MQDKVVRISAKIVKERKAKYGENNLLYFGAELTTQLIFINCLLYAGDQSIG
jgi:hypothetical protein